MVGNYQVDVTNKVAVILSDFVILASLFGLSLIIVPSIQDS